MRKYFRRFISFIIIISSITYIYGEPVENNNDYGFKQTAKDYVESIESEIITYEHTKSGAQVLHIKNLDPNQAFAIGFKTPAHDNTGVNHIVEHAVFTGSEKYNIKDVFFEMKKKSPNIFMNASTAVDMTIYPFATRNNKDYGNLLDVYLDAVFFPNLQDQRYGFDQEGWHYSIDKDQRYQINGVVYNEMKGASVAPRRILAMANRKAMFPDTMYIYNAGGNPDEIPNLTYEAFKKTHHQYYTPSNSCSFIYGDVEIAPVLAKLDGYYSRFTKKQDQNISQKQEPFEKTKYYTEFYPATSKDANYYMSTNFAVGEIDDVKLQLSMGILMEILTQYEDSPLRKAFRESQKSRTIAYDIDSAIPQPMYSIIATDVKQDDLKDVEVLINETLENTAEVGFNNEIIKMAINNYEINMKQKTSQTSKGIDMAYELLYGWGHGVSPVSLLQEQEFIDEIKEEGESLYFQNLIKTQLLENNHKSQVILIPDVNYIAKAQAKESQSIEAEGAKDDVENRETLIKNKAELEKWQQAKNPVGSLPELELEDINQSISLPKLTIKENENMYYIADTNELIYMDLYFDTSYIPQESLNELFLFSHLLQQKEKNLVALYTGGIESSAIAIPKFEWYNEYDPKLRLSMCIQSNHIDKAFEILDQVTHNNTWEEQWLLSQIHKLSSQYEQYFNANPLEIVNRSVANTQEGASRYEYEKIVGFYNYICEIEANFDKYKEQVTQKLKVINNSIFNKDTIILGATLEEKSIKALEKNYKKYTEKLNDGEYPKIKYKFDQKKKRQGFPIAQDVQYISWAGNYKENGGEYDGTLYVLANILNSDYMLENIRVKNGAYGAGVKFSPYGHMNIYTYQDPKLLESLKIIEDIPSYITQLDISEKDLEAHKIGAFSKFEQELGLNQHPLAVGETLQQYALSGLSNEKLGQIKQEIFETTLSDINNKAVVLEKLINDRRYSVAGSKSKLLTNTGYFDIIQSFQNTQNKF